MKRYDRPYRERAEYLKERGWKWEVIAPNPEAPRMFKYNGIPMMRPKISVFTEDEG